MTHPAPRPSRRPRRNWVVVTEEEVADLWLGGKGLSVLLGFSLLLAVLSYLAAAQAGVNLLDARESVGVVVTTSIGLGTLSALVVSADAIAGERERGTLEALLVTPVSRRALVIGKLLASSTMWVASLLVALPFVVAMARGAGVVAAAVATLVLAGALVAAALTALGLAVSSVSRSNRVSLASAVTILLLLAAPSQLPTVTSSGMLGTILIEANPVSAGLAMADNVVVKQQSWAAQWSLMVSPLLAAILLTALAVASARRLELGGAR